MNANHDDSRVIPLRSDGIAPAGHWPTPSAVWMGWLLAFIATMLSLVVSGLVGWQRGNALAEQVLLAGFGALAVLGAHWLLPLLRTVPVGFPSRLAGVLLWLACLVYAATSHADFFIGVQARRADHRMAAMASEVLAGATMPKRSLSAILEEEAGVRAKWMQARFAEASCDGNCRGLRIRQVEHQSRLAALAAEEEEARRWQVMQDQLRARRETARDDPVTARLQRDFGVTPAVASAVTVLPVAVILEGMGAFCWCMVLQARGMNVTRFVPQSVTAQVTQSEYDHVDVSPARESMLQAAMPFATPQPVKSVTAEVGHDDSPEQLEVRTLAAKVWTEIQLGQVKPTVRSIRASLGIAQEQARAVARVVRVWRSEAT